MIKPRDTRALEDAFFREKDQFLLDRLREMKRMQETRETLSQVSGIRNETILKRLVELDVRPEMLAAMAVVPLVEVAWADGRLDEREKAAVLKAAGAKGLTPMECGLIEHWLVSPPKPALLEAWSHYIEGLCEGLAEGERRALREELIGMARAVAEASGGFLGMGPKASAAEETVLKKLEESFRCG